VDNTDMLRVEGLTVAYGRAVTAVRDVSITVRAEEVVGILGPNGAGKSSLLRAIGGLLPLEPAKAVAGTMVIDGLSVRPGTRPSRMSRLGVNLVPERLKVFSSLTVAEHFALLKTSREEVQGYCGRFPWLQQLLGHSAGDLSGGQRQLLGLLCALSKKPKLLLIDEFSLGLSPAAIIEVTAAIQWARKETQASVLLVEQNVEVACALCDRIYLMSNGELVWSGEPAEARTRVLRGAYFG
jgi:branched-chain amino acid transport system ATP-binding protein